MSFVFVYLVCSAYLQTIVHRNGEREDWGTRVQDEVVRRTTFDEWI